MAFKDKLAKAFKPSHKAARERAEAKASASGMSEAEVEAVGDAVEEETLKARRKGVAAGLTLGVGGR